MKSYNVQIKNN